MEAGIHLTGMVWIRVPEKALQESMNFALHTPSIGNPQSQNKSLARPSHPPFLPESHAEANLKLVRRFKE